MISEGHELEKIIFYKPNVAMEINLQYPLEGLMLKLQYFGHLMQRIDSLEKTLLLGKIECKGEGGSRG